MILIMTYILHDTDNDLYITHMILITTYILHIENDIYYLNVYG